MSFDPTSTVQSGDDLDIALFERYCAGDANPAQRAQIEAWLESHPEERVWYEHVRTGLMQGGAPVVSDLELQQRLATVMHHAGHTENDFAENTHRTESSARDIPRSASYIRRHVRWLTHAGIAAVLVIAGWIGGTHRSSMMLDIERVSTYTTANGQRATITLPDGTVVSLNNASRLEVPVGYSVRNRTVRLQGEALFTVVSGTGRPFTVATSQATVRVLGTTFRVQEYASDTSAIVSVRDGKVSVASQTGVSTVLTAMQEVSVKSYRELRARETDFSRFTFTTGLLTFNGTTLGEAAPALGRWYDAEIRFGDPALTQQRIKGSFSSGSLSDLSTILEWTYGVRVVRHGRVITLYLNENTAHESSL